MKETGEIYIILVGNAHENQELRKQMSLDDNINKDIPCVCRRKMLNV
jgi:hypothetical protein